MVGFKGERISRTSSFKLDGSVEQVFPLFGPIMEKEWAAGWDPQVIFSTSEWMEKGMVFQTSSFEPSEGQCTWIISGLRPADNFIEYTVFTCLRVWVIAIECKQCKDHTLATVQYTYTGTSQEGNVLNKKALEHMFADDLKDWQEAINHYLIRRELFKPLNKPLWKD